MPPFIRFLCYRLLSIPVTLILITMVLYAFVMMTPVDVRASIYFGSGFNPDRFSEQELRQYTDQIISRYHLRDPYPIQYARWVFRLVSGDWGYSPVFEEDVLNALLRRTPVTAELAIFSMILFIPLGIISGVWAGWKRDGTSDRRFRLFAFIGTSLPPVILALVLLSIFYVGLRWFPPERLSLANYLYVNSDNFRTYTGFIVIDGLLNSRPDISLDALRHLVLPVITLSLAHWATLGRLTRATMIEELGKDYVTAGKARGFTERRMVWKHAFRNALSPALNSSMLSAATLFTGVFVVEVIFNFKGISELAVVSTLGPPDAASLLGFAVYSVLIVLCLMFVLDVALALFDPRIQEGLIEP